MFTVAARFRDSMAPFTIGGSGAIESLNLAATVNMCAYELSR